MSAKTLIIIVAVLAILMTAITVGIVGVYKYDRTLLGLPPAPPDSTLPDTTQIWFNISEKRYNYLEKSLKQKNQYKKQKDSLEKLKKYLLDSIKAVQASLGMFNDSIKTVEKSKNLTLKEKSKLNDSLKKLNQEYMQAQRKIELEKELQKNLEKELTQKQDSSKTKNFETFAKIYNNSSAAEVARILEQIDEQDAAKILKLMKQKKAGKVIEAMQPEQAAAILLLGGYE